MPLEIPPPPQASDFQTALLQQAEQLAREQLDQARSARARLEAQVSEKLTLEAARETLAVKAEAEQQVKRQIQAAQTRLAADLDRLRWALTETTLAQMRRAFQTLTEDEGRYLPLLESWLAAAARDLPPGDVVVSIRAQDLARLEPVWDDLVARAAPGRRVARAVMSSDSLGGLRVMLADGRARCDQTFEAREARQAPDLARVAMAQLFAGAPGLEA